MIIFGLVQRLLAFLSIALLAVGGWLIWSWWDVERTARAIDPALNPDETQLYWGLALIAWSFLGRLPVMLFAGKGGGATHRFQRAPGEMIAGADGSELRIEAYGPADAPVIVFTHGWGLDSTLWIEAKMQLADRYRLVVWDLPGLGKSTQPADGRYSLERLAGDLRAVIEHASPRGKVLLVGHSIGGMIVQTLFRDHSEFAHERVGGVVLEDTTHTNPVRTMAFSRLLVPLQKPLIEPMQKLDIPLSPLIWLMNWQSYFSGHTHLAFRSVGFGTQPTRRALDHSARVATKHSPAVQAKGNLAMMNWSATDALRGIAVPVVVFAGGRDVVTLPGAGETIVGAVRDGRSVFVAEAGHMGPIECSMRYNSEIAAMADRVLLADAVGAPAQMQSAAPLPETDGRERGEGRIARDSPF